MKQSKAQSQNMPSGHDLTALGVASESPTKIFPHEAGLDAVLKHEGAIPLVPRNGLRLLDLRQSAERADDAEVAKIAQRFDAPVEVLHDILYHGADLELYQGSVWQGDRVFDGMYHSSPPTDQRPAIDQLKRAGRVRKLEGCYAYIQKRGPQNYFHWMIESFPRLQLVVPLIEAGQIDGIVLLYERDAPSFVSQSICIDYPHVVDRVVNSPGPVISVEDLHFFVSGGAAAGQQPGSATRITTATKAMIDNVPRKTTPGEHVVFVTRNSFQRNLINETALIEYLSRYYEVDVVSGHTLTVAEQRERFATPRAIVGVHGAGLSNAVYAPMGCKLIEINSSKYLYRTHCFYDVSILARGIPFVALGDRVKTKKTKRFEDIFISPDRFVEIRNLIS